MDRQRRNFLGFLGLGALAMAGCRPSTSGSGWERVDRPASNTPTPNSASFSAGIGEDQPRIKYEPLNWKELEAPTGVGNFEILDHAIGRDVWSDAKPIFERLNPMTTPTRITVHHTGMLCTTLAKDDIIESLREFRRHHVKAFNAGDIGYHYLIDRNGGLWIGRELKFQGAHVKDQNEGNIGVVAMGNFEDQEPTAAQLTTLNQTIPALVKRYSIPLNHVRTHREMAPTLCPGRNLQGRFEIMRDRKFA